MQSCSPKAGHTPIKNRFLSACTAKFIVTTAQMLPLSRKTNEISRNFVDLHGAGPIEMLPQIVHLNQGTDEQRQ
jgi:hypothetical protein